MTTRWASEEELEAARKRRDRTRTTVTADPVEAEPVVALPPLKPADPKKAAEDGFQRVMDSFTSDRTAAAQLVRTMRFLYPDLVARMSDGQIIEKAKEIYQAKLRDSTNRVFDKLGRGNELKIKLDGH